MKNSEVNDVTTDFLDVVLKAQFNDSETYVSTDLKKDEQEFPGLDIKVYNQDVLEKKILDQVDRAIKSQKLKNNAELFSTSENLAMENQKKTNDDECEKGKEELEGFPTVDAAEESEREKKIRMGEMTPFGTVISFKTIEGNHLQNIEKYLQSQVKIINKQRGLKRKNCAQTHKTSSTRKLIQSASKKKKISTESDKNPVFSRKKSLETLKNETYSDSQESFKKSQFHELGNDHSSGSEYVPSEDNSEDSDCELKPKLFKTKKKRKKLISSVIDDEVDQSNSDNKYSYERKIKCEKDDGDKEKYLLRLEKWEKQNCRDDIETQVRTLDDSFKMPLVIWNKLYNYQRVGVQWLWELNLQQCGGIIGDEMGLGKTIQVISFLAGLSISKLISRHGSFQGLGPVLIVCPTTVMHQWIKEFHQWWPQFRVALLHESGTYNGRKTDLIKGIVKENGILITSYVTCIQQSHELLRHTWHYVILDEGHKIRNPDSQITTTVKLLKTPHRLILSGSPMQNNLKELWSLFDFIFPGKLGTLPVFLAEFGVPITQGGYANASKIQVATAFKCATVLRDTISPYLLRRAKEDVKTHINLPPKNEQVLFCRLTEEQKELYVDYINSGKVMEILNGKQRVFVGLIDLRKICNHPHLYSGGPKLSEWNIPTLIPEEEKFGYWKKAGKMIVMETLLKLWKKQGHRVLIFTQSRKMLEILETFVRSQNYEYIKIDGSTAIGSRQPLITKFNENKKYYIFLSTTHVGGLGVNLTGANRVVIYDPDWNPATDAQARERAWRIGQENQVTIYRLVTSGTIEEKIYHRQIFKQFLTNKVLKDPSQRRFFKSNDLYELFTFKDCEHSNETSALFAGTNYELNLNNFPKRSKKEKFKNKMHFEPNSIKNDVEAQQILTKEKIERMKQMAQTLSRKIALNTLKEGSNADITVKNTASESVDKGDDKQTSESKSIRNDISKPINAMHSAKKIKKLKKKKSCDKRLDGEIVPHLQKQKQYRDVLKDAINYDKDDDYILKKLFSKSGVQSALQHDQIMESGPADYALIEGEAEKVAKEAVKALKESRKHYPMNFSELFSFKPPAKPRFGKKTFRQQASNSLSSSDTNSTDKNKIMTSAELLYRIRQRNGLCPVIWNTSENPITENSELLANIRNFISFGAEMENKATTQEIIDKFRDRLPSGQTPLFKALLNEICEFHRTLRGEGIWELRSDFRW